MDPAARATTRAIARLAAVQPARRAGRADMIRPVVALVAMLAVGVAVRLVLLK